MLLSIILSLENPIFTISSKQKGKKNKQTIDDDDDHVEWRKKNETKRIYTCYMR